MTPEPDKRPNSSRTTAGSCLAILLLAATSLYVFPLWWGMPIDSISWAYDEIHPDGMIAPDLWTPYYPPAHRHVLGAAIRVLGPLLTALSPEHFTATDVHLLIARSITVLLAVMTLVLLYASSLRLFDRRSALASVVCFGFGAPWTFYAKTANLDVPYLFWFALSLYFFLRCLEDRRWYHYLLFAAAGALSITTKTQAFGLYVVSPLVLVHDLRSAENGTRKSVWQALLDRRILESAAVCLAVVLVVFRRGELEGHIDAVRSFEHFDPAGTHLAGFLTASLTNLVFVLGVPATLLALAGFGLALYRPHTDIVRTRLLQLLLFVVPYYILFVVRTGFNYDRHFLPIALILSLFAALTFDRLLRSRRGIRLLTWSALALVLAVGALRALSVDLLLHGDPRYEAERWIATLDPAQRVTGLGNRQVLPRGLRAVPTKRFAKWRRGEHGHNPLVWHNCKVLDELDSELLVTPIPELLSPGVNYRELRRFSNRAPFSIVDFSNDSASNVSKVARDVIVYERTSRKCVDSGWLPRALDELPRDRDSERRKGVARAIARSPLLSPRKLTWSDMKAIRVDNEYWTIGTQPAGVVLENLWFEPVTPRLQLTVPLLDQSDLPATVFIDDGEKTREIVFERGGRRTIALAPVDGEAVRLYIVWIDKAYRTPEGRLRGVRILPDGEPGDPFERLSTALARLARGATADERTALVRSVLAGVAGETVPVAEDAVMIASWRDLWTYGTAPAGLIIHNTRSAPIRPRVHVACDSFEGRPVHLTIEDGIATHRYPLDCVKPVSIKLARIKPGERRLFILQSDHASLPQTESEKLRGIQVREVILDPKAAREETSDLDRGANAPADEIDTRDGSTEDADPGDELSTG